MYGVSSEQVTHIWGRMQETMPTQPSDLRALHSSLFLLATNVSWDQLADCQPLWTSSGVNERTLRRDFNRIGDLFLAHPLMNPMLRFSHTIPWMEQVTVIVDATTVQCRAKREVRRGRDDDENEPVIVDRTYSGKTRTRCFKIEIHTTMCGVPIFARRCVAGSMHDARLFKEGSKLYQHYTWETFLVDLGYEGCGHVLTPFKRRRGEQLSADDALFNKKHGLVRSRIERLFSFMDLFRCFWHTEHNEKWLDRAVAIVLNVFYSLFASQPQYGDAVPLDLASLEKQSAGAAAGAVCRYQPIDVG